MDMMIPGNLIRRTLVVTSAPIFKSFRRMVPQVASAMAVPVSPPHFLSLTEQEIVQGVPRYNRGARRSAARPPEGGEAHSAHNFGQIWRSWM